MAIMMRWHMPPESSNGYWCRTPLRVGDADRLEHCARRLSGFGPAAAAVDRVGLRDLGADGRERVEGGGGLLEDDGQALAAHAPHGALRQPREVGSLQSDVASGQPHARRQQAQERERGQRLSAAGLPDQRQDLALPERERYAVDEPRARDLEGEILDGEQRLRREMFGPVGWPQMGEVGVHRRLTVCASAGRAGRAASRRAR
jgi:hypothetical protein